MTIWHSLWAFFFFIFVGVILVWNLIRKKRKYPSLLYGNWNIMRNLKTRGIRAYLAFLPDFFRLLALSFVILALARPQRADTKIKKNVQGIDIIICLDISDSMLIEDMQPVNRLEASKKTIEEFINKRVTDRIGLVVFSGESYTRVPLTLDYELLKENLKQVQTTRNIKMGTAIGVALANAVARLKDSKAKSRVVIFLTDGENNTGTISPATAIDIAKDYNVRIYSIGMGLDGQARLPVYMQGIGGRKIKTYRPIHSKVNEKLLRKMAEETGGKYYRATTSRALENVFNDINKLEKTKFEVNQYVKYEELFTAYLKWAFWLYVLGFFLGQTVLRRDP
ncbi:MAG: VWA domain-containing protein [Bdellovibrio sp.]|nr:MAG: VWA domain-containing protein [Bdellovibrio sp.]